MKVLFEQPEVILSLRTEFVGDIKRGRKTLELRKNMPSIRTPFKVHVYEPLTPHSPYFGNFCHPWVRERVSTSLAGIGGSGLIVGEFSCSCVGELINYGIYTSPNYDFEHPQGVQIPADRTLEAMLCIDRHIIKRYLKGGHGFLWEISNPLFYEKPLPLSNFIGVKGLPIKRPPLSWCYTIGRNDDENSTEQ